MHVAFLDASKAFDRITHILLMDKLRSAYVPVYLLRIIAFWYCNQSYCVRWGSTISSSFTVSNGVRQGGVLSPLLFNYYMDGLSVALNNLPIGCCCNNIIINHLMYADDVVIFAPSRKGLQKLLDVCDRFGQINDIVYNPSKSKFMLFGSHRFNSNNDLVLGGTNIECVDSYKYLGHVIGQELGDELDIRSKERSLYARSNMLNRKFYFCTPAVKRQLFQSYCSSIYLSFLWCKFTKSTLRSITVAYNNSFRILFQLPRFCSASAMFAMNSVLSFDALCRKQIFSFKNRVICSMNQIVTSLVNSDYYCMSPLVNLWDHVLFTCFM